MATRALLLARRARLWRKRASHVPLRYLVPILIRPFPTWRRLASERMPLAALLGGYVLPLAAIGPVATFVARRIVGFRTGHVVYHASVGEAFGGAAFAFVLAIVGLLLVAGLVDVLAPAFGARRSFGKALLVAAFAYTPVWIAGVVVLAPAFGFVALLALAYEIFLLHAGLAIVMDVPRGKAGGLAACAVLGTILIAVGFGAISAVIAGGGFVAL